jgi:hypothetical protein
LTTDYSRLGVRVVDTLAAPGLNARHCMSLKRRRGRSAAVSV